MSERKKSFIMYESWAAFMCELPDDKAIQLMRAICAYQIGTEYEIEDPILTAYFKTVVMPSMERNEEKYQEKVTRVNAINDGRKSASSEVVTKSSRSRTDIVPKSSRSRTDIARVDVDVDDNVSAKADIDSAELKRGVDSAADRAPAPADVESLPLTGGSEWRPTQEEFAEYERLFPAVDVRQQFRSMRAWCLANPERRKTKAGIRRFVSRWLSKEQDSGKGARSGTAESGHSGRSAPFRKTKFDNYSMRVVDYDALLAKSAAGGGARSGAESGSQADDGFMDIPDSVDDADLPFN